MGDTVLIRNAPRTQFLGVTTSLLASISFSGLFKIDGPRSERREEALYARALISHAYSRHDYGARSITPPPAWRRLRYIPALRNAARPEALEVELTRARLCLRGRS